MNKVVLIGRLTKDPELRFAPGTGTAVATFNLAVDRRVPGKDGKREADFIPIVVWGKQAESTANYMTKGKLMGVAGRIQTRSYDAKDGRKRYVTEVMAEEVQFLEWGNTGEQGQNNKPQGNQYEDLTPVDEDEEIPF